ncbi:hypothetical protein ACP70R_040035 [Stipagrostis hirtigluma subsp. patula]
MWGSQQLEDATGVNWQMAKQPAVHVPGGPFQRLPPDVANRPFGKSCVRYREDPKEYLEDRVLCWCHKKAYRFISWGKYPGRRYYSCPELECGCDFKEWYDPPFSQYVTNLVGDLRDRVIMLEGEVAEHKAKAQEVKDTVTTLIGNLKL